MQGRDGRFWTQPLMWVAGVAVGGGQLHGPWQLHTDQSVEWRPSAVQDAVKS